MFQSTFVAENMPICSRNIVAVVTTSGLGIGLKFSQDDIVVTAVQMSVGRTGHDGASMGFIIRVEIRWMMSDRDRELGPPVESSARSSVRFGFGAAARASIWL